MTDRFLPYGRQNITEADIAAVVAVLRSDWLTQGPAVPAFEGRLCEKVGAAHAVACANGTAGLHLAMLALGLGPGDAILTTPITFVASANCARYLGADVRFADIDPGTGLLDPLAVAETLAADREHRIKAIVPVHFAGQPVDLDAMVRMADAHGAIVVDDACHALGAQVRGNGGWNPVGRRSGRGMTVFSFHPVKHVTTGEGGAVTTPDPVLAERLQTLRSHGIRKESFLQEEMAVDPEAGINPWYYEQQMLGLNYRLTDFQAALGASQLGMLPESVRKRNQIAAWYEEGFRARFPDGNVSGLEHRPDVLNAYHLFVARIDFNHFGVSRATVMKRLRSAGIGTQVHYIPVHLQPYYREASGTRPGDLPKAEAFYQSILSLPMYPELDQADILRVIAELGRALGCAD